MYYPCLSTRSLLDKARDTLVSKVAQAKIGEIHRANQMEWIDEGAKGECMQRIATGQIQMGYDVGEQRDKWARNEGEDAGEIDRVLDEEMSEMSLRDFQAIAKEIKLSRFKSKGSHFLSTPSVHRMPL